MVKLALFFSLLLVFLMILSPVVAFASQDSEFAPLKERIWSWIKGNLALTIVGAALIVGAAFAIGGRIGALASCVVIAIAFGVGPDILTSLIGATASTPW